MFRIISLLGNNPQSTQLEDGDITEKKIRKAQKKVSKILETLIKDIPSSYSSLHNTLNRFVIKK